VSPTTDRRWILDKKTFHVYMLKKIQKGEGRKGGREGWRKEGRKNRLQWFTPVILATW
jgi:hypothetical protein